MPVPAARDEIGLVPRPDRRGAGRSVLVSPCESRGFLIHDSPVMNGR